MSVVERFDAHYLERCSFCRKTRAEVLKLIAADTGISICDECIGLCNEIIAEEQAKDASALPRAHVPARSGWRSWLRRVF